MLYQHPVYQTWLSVWEQLLDVYEGAGGFLDAARPYLYAHPREWLDHSIRVTLDGDQAGQVRWDANPSPSRPSPKLRTRRKMARYENVAATLLDQIRAALFRKSAERSFADPQKIADDHPLKRFWADADGCGRSIDAVMPEFWTVAGVFGHMPIYAERNGETGDQPTQADAPPVVLRGYTPIDMPDWLVDDMGRLTAVKFLEAAPRESFEDVATGSYQVRTITDTAWTVEILQRGKTRKTEAAEVPVQNAHGFTVLPVVMLYARRRALTPIVGRSVLGDPALYLDLYNLVSEVRELLRNQTFAILNIPIGDKTGGVEAEMALVGQTSGTGNILFSSQPADFISPPDTNVAAYHEHIDRLVRTIYRLSVIAWESDSRDAESADSRKLKKEDLHQMLAGYASECEDAETQIAKLVYRAHYGARWEAQWDADGPSISYPDDFDVESLTEMLENASAAMALELGETATKELKKRVATHLLPGASQPTLQTILTEIDALQVKTAAEQEMELLQARFGGQPPETRPPTGEEVAA